MPLSPRQRGFTLIEILIVILLLGIATSVVVVNFTPLSIQRLGRLEGDKLVSVLEYLRDQSLLEHRFYRLSVTPSEYSVFSFDELKGQWVADVNVMSHRLPEGLGLHIDRKRSDAGVVGVLVDAKAANEAVTDILIEPEGALSPFTLAVYGNQSRLVILSLVSDGLNISSVAQHEE